MTDHRSARPSRRAAGARPAVAPMARAIRTALTVSALAFSLGAQASPVAAAPSGCTYVAAASGCDGLAAIAAAHDPTRVLDALPPVAVHGVGDRVLGTTTIDHDGETEVVSAGDATGLAASDTYVIVNNVGRIAARGGTSAIGVDLSGGELGFANAGEVFAETVQVGDYGYAPAIAVRAFGEQVLVDNADGGTLAVYADADGAGSRARARGVYAVAFGGEVDVRNDGDIDAIADATGGRAEAHGIYAFGYGGPTTVTNDGDIDSHASAVSGRAYATGINAIGYGSGANTSHVTNAGDIAAQADGDLGAYAFGIFNLTRQRDGSAVTENAGDIVAGATGHYATATGIINLALRYGDATLVNTGTVTAAADGVAGATATGLYERAYVYDAVVDNTGTVDASARADLAIAVGIYGASGIHGDADVANAGAVTATATGGSTGARAAGVVASSEHAAAVANHGDIDVLASSLAGTVTAVGLYALGTELATIDNHGAVTASAVNANGGAHAYGALVATGPLGIGTLVNAGVLDAYAAATGGDAHATGGFVTAEVGSIFNDGTATAVAVATDGSADARAASVYSIYGVIENAGVLTAGAEATGGDALARGADVFGVFGSTVDNAGDIVARADAVGGDATATGVYSLALLSSSYVYNTGAVQAVAHGDAAVAQGLVSVSLYYGHGVTVNSGDVTAIAVGGFADYGEVEATAFGIYNAALLYSSVVLNSGDVVAVAEALNEIAPQDGFLTAQALGILAVNGYGLFDTAIYNAGNVSASARTSTGFATAWGLAAQTSGLYGGDVVIENDGSVQAYAHADIGVAIANGVYASNLYGDIGIVNHGDVLSFASTERGVVNVVVDYAYAYGVIARGGLGATDVANYGNITAVASSYGAINGALGVQAAGAQTTVTNAAGAVITAVAEAEVFGGAFATGVMAYGVYAADVANQGTIVARSYASALLEGENGFYGATRAMGIFAAANTFGDVGIVNDGDILAIAQSDGTETFFLGGAGATGVHAYAKYDAVVENNGLILASATSDLGIVGAYGAIGEGKYRAEVVNHGDIIAVASSGSLATDTYGGRAIAMGVKIFHSDHGVIANDGLIAAHASVTADGGPNAVPSLAMAWGAEIGAYSTVLYGTIENAGRIEASATADYGYATAYGTFIDTRYDATTVNAGDVLAVASAQQGDAWAVGALGRAIDTDYIVPCDENGCDYSEAYFVVTGGTVSLDNTGTIAALAQADGGVAHAYGAVAVAGSGARIVNAGDIVAVADGDDATAFGVLANAILGDARVDNAGAILAGAYGASAEATAVSLVSDGVNTLFNTGTIAAYGDGERFAVQSSGNAAGNLHNAGTLVGAVRTGDGDDLLSNAGTWRLFGDSTFGAGADTIFNTGLVWLQGATIALGGDTGDRFDQRGVLVVRDTGNSIDVAGGVFANDGHIVLLDGAADDALAIAGTFAGTGRLGFDVDGLAGTGDTLTIDGDVDAAAVQTLDVDLLTRPESAQFQIGLVTVSGDSHAGNFVLGDVAYASDLVTLDFGLVADIDAAGQDVFSLGVSVSGLTDAGELAAALSPGVQALVDAQVGTWRQRMGVVPRQGDDAPDVWVRGFSHRGDLDADHAGFGTGGVAIRHDSHGIEAGIDFPLTERLTAGLLTGRSDATQHLRDGAGRTRLDASTVGVYATWQAAGGFYLDLSQRWTGVDAQLRHAGGTVVADLDADIFNVEAGFTAWTLGGVGITPQLQYTHATVGGTDPLQFGASTYADAGGTSSRARAGVLFDGAVDAGAWSLVPYASVGVVHEFDGDYAHAINGGIDGTTSTAGTSALVELGLGARRGDWTLTGGVGWSDGGAQDGVVGGQLNVRYAW